MNALIIYCHPSKESYTHDVLMQLTKHLEQEDILYEIADLYQLNFQSDMTEEEYQREGLANTELPIPNDVLAEQKKIAKADCIIFLYPVWWSDCPAKLKGWFDRVYSVGYAYGTSKSAAHEIMKKVKYGLVLCIAGHPNEFLQKIGIAESMRTVMIDDRLGERFQIKEMVILGGTLDIEKVRTQHSDSIATIGSRIKEHCS